MVVSVIDYVGRKHFVPGPPDLAQYGDGFTLTYTGELREIDLSTWALSVGLFILRGGDVAHS